MGYSGIGNEAVAIDEECFGANGEAVDSTVHSGERSTENVDFVDFLWRHKFYCPGEGFALDDGAKQVALMLGELLGVVE